MGKVTGMDHGRNGIQPKAAWTLWGRPKGAEEMYGKGTDFLSWRGGQDM